jgi:quercetin dioxygenase-like cupin family protein
MQRVLDNPISGERIIIRQSGAETGGQLLVFDLFLQPGGHVPAGHVHPRQEERFSVLRGRVRFRLGRRIIVARPGDALVVPCGTSHWFGNGGQTVAQVRVEVRPALRMEQLFEETVQRAAARSPWWSRLLDWALVPLDFQPELAVPNVPAVVILAVLSPLAWMRFLIRSCSPAPQHRDAVRPRRWQHFSIGR